MIISIATDIRDVLDETLDKEFKRRKPLHRRDEVKKSKKDASTEERDDENEKLADVEERDRQHRYHLTTKISQTKAWSH